MEPAVRRISVLLTSNSGYTNMQIKFLSWPTIWQVPKSAPRFNIICTFRKMSDHLLVRNQLRMNCEHDWQRQISGWRPCGVAEYHYGVNYMIIIRRIDTWDSTIDNCLSVFVAQPHNYRLYTCIFQRQEISRLLIWWIIYLYKSINIILTYQGFPRDADRSFLLQIIRRQISSCLHIIEPTSTCYR